MGKARNDNRQREREAYRDSKRKEKQLGGGGFVKLKIWPFVAAIFSFIGTILLNFFASNPRIFYLIPVAIFALSFYCVHHWVRYLENGARFKEGATTDENSITPAFRLEQRAYLAPAGISGTPREGAIYDVAVVIRNSGKTWASKVRPICAVKAYCPGEVPEFDRVLERLRAAADTRGSEGLLGPGEPLSLIVNPKNEDSTPMTMTFQNIENIKAGRIIWFVFGNVSYKDIFGCSHWTTFSWFLGTDGLYRVYESYNEPDKNTYP